MKFEKMTQKNKKVTYFPAGVYDATIESVQMRVSEKGHKMFVLKLSDGEYIGFYYLMFEMEHSDKYLNFLLNSIDDHGEVIPDMNFGYNLETKNFLENKEVYIEVVDKVYDGKKRTRIQSFLLLKDYNDLCDESDSDEYEEDDGPY